MFPRRIIVRQKLSNNTFRCAVQEAVITNKVIMRGTPICMQWETIATAIRFDDAVRKLDKINRLTDSDKVVGERVVWEHLFVGEVTIPRRIALQKLSNDTFRYAVQEEEVTKSGIALSWRWKTIATAIRLDDAMRKLKKINRLTGSDKVVGELEVWEQS